MTLFRSALFFVWFAATSVIFSVAFLPALALPRTSMLFVPRVWGASTLWGLRIFAGLDFEVRGEIPRGRVLVAAKHMSMWDTLALYHLLDDSAFVVKRELLKIPFYGWYVRKSGAIAIDRDGRASALKDMASAARNAIAMDRPVVIFPEGTRKRPGQPPDYKPGVAALYRMLDVPCVPAALNSGQFWTGPLGFLKKRGRIVVEFLPPIPVGLTRRDFMETLETRIESATDGLLREGETLLAGGK
jgi:1-acyl-sn-glycerol-3-phosphate acyltransferase